MGKTIMHRGLVNIAIYLGEKSSHSMNCKMKECLGQVDTWHEIATLNKCISKEHNPTDKWIPN